MLGQHHRNRPPVAGKTVFDHGGEKDMLLFAVMAGIGKLAVEGHELLQVAVAYRDAELHLGGVIFESIENSQYQVVLGFQSLYRVHKVPGIFSWVSIFIEPGY
jgi:hypothetical protein